jgi:hypothetical protein
LFGAFGGRGKKRLNRVFDAIGFVHPDYHYPLQGQGKRIKTAASATTVVPAAPKNKKIKVLTHRPRYIEPTVVPELGEGASSTAKARQVAPIAQSVEEPTIVPKMPTVGPVEAKDDKAEEPKMEETMKIPEILSPPTEAKLPKVQKASAATPKRRRMASVLDAMLETTKALNPPPTKKTAKAAKAQVEAEAGQTEAEAGQAEAKAGPSVPSEMKVVTPEDEADQQTSDAVMVEEQDTAERAKSPAPEAAVEDANYIYRHGLGKTLSEEEVLEARHYAQKLKYSKGALVFNDTNDDDFLYCLPDNNEISVSQEMAKSMGFSKLEEGLSGLSKDELADSLAYNSIKV